VKRDLPCTGLVKMHLTDHSKSLCSERSSTPGECVREEYPQRASEESVCRKRAK